MKEIYNIEVSLQLNDRLSASLLRVGDRFNSLNEKTNRITKSVLALEQALYHFRTTERIAESLAAPFTKGVTEAAKLQREMIGVQAVTRGTTKEMDTMRLTIEKIAGQTVFSNIDVADMAKTIASGTGLSATDVSGLLPIYAKFADVQYLLKGTSYKQSVADSIRLAHTAQHYDPQSLSKYLDLLTKVSFLVPGGLGEVGHALKYSQGIAKTALGVDDENMIMLVALLNRLGFAGSRGGTNLIASMTRSIPGIFGSGLLEGKSAIALNKMGMSDANGRATFFTDGKFDSVKWMQKLSAYVAKEFASNPEEIARQNIVKNFYHAMGAQGSRVAALLSGPESIGQLKLIGDRLSSGNGAEAVQSLFASQSVWQQMENATTNTTSLFAELGYSVLPDVNKAMKIVNDVLSRMIEYVSNHQTAFKYVSATFAALGGSVAIAGFAALTKFLVVFAGLTLPITGTIGAITAAIVGLYAAYNNWEGIKTGFKEAWTGITDFVSWVAWRIGLVWDKLKSAFGLSNPGGSVYGGEFGGIGFTTAPQKQPITVVSVLDGKVVGKSVTGYQAKQSQYSIYDSGSFDGRLGLAGVMGY